MTLPKSKRLRFALYTMHLLVVVGMYGMHIGADLTGLAVYMTVTVIPLVAYITGDSLRPSNLNDINK
jgi:hypothetical protein